MAIINIRYALADAIIGRIFQTLVGTGMRLDATDCSDNPRAAATKVLKEAIDEIMQEQLRKSTILERI